MSYTKGAYKVAIKVFKWLLKNVMKTNLNQGCFLSSTGMTLTFVVQNCVQ